MRNISFILIAIILIAGGLFLAVGEFFPVLSQKASTVQAERQMEAVERREKEVCEREENLPIPQGPWKTFELKEMGLSFQYPPKYQLVSYIIGPGDTGKMLSGFMSPDPPQKECPDPRKISITFLGLTPNYTAGRGGRVSDNLGYEKRDGMYILRYLWNKNYVVPYPVKEIRTKNTTGVIITGTGIIGESHAVLLPYQRMAVFNLKSSEYSAISFEIDIQQVSEEEFESILRTIEVY